MSLRTTTPFLLRALFAATLVVPLALSACADSTNADAQPDAAETVLSNLSLTFDPLPEGSVLANSDVKLAVKFGDSTGGAVDNVQVEFSLTSSATGASLAPSRATTDATGVARTTLRVGSTTAGLEVRARARGAIGYVNLSVEQANASRVSVRVGYLGTRAVSSYTVTSLPGMDCAKALRSGLAGEVSYTFAAEDESVSFELGAGLTTAIVGWGRDTTGSKLVRGCKEFTALTTNDQSKTQSGLVLTLEDLPLTLDSTLPVELELNVTGAAQQLSAAVTKSVDRALTPTGSYAMFAEADYYLDAVAKLLTTQNNSASLAALTSLRTSSALAASLDPALSKGGVGPKAVGTAVGKLLTTRGAGITLRSSYSTKGLAAVSDLSVLSADGTRSLSFSSVPGTTLPTVSLSSTFSAASAELVVSALRIELPLGRYGRTLLAGLETENAGVLPTLVDAAGCTSVFGPWWSKNDLVSVGDSTLAITACEAALRALRTQIDGDLSALDAQSPVITLAGRVQAHDRSEDGDVDDLGPDTLTGSWGTVTLNSQLRVPVRTAFTAFTR
jgi:hypothetical protein